MATYGPELIGDYGRSLIIYYVVCFAYMLTSSPIYARFGGGKGAAKVMFAHLFARAAVSFATCSSVAMPGILGGGTGDLVLCAIFFPDQLAIAYPISIAPVNLKL